MYAQAGETIEDALRRESHTLFVAMMRRCEDIQADERGMMSILLTLVGNTILFTKQRSGYDWRDGFLHAISCLPECFPDQDTPPA